MLERSEDSEALYGQLERDGLIERRSGQWRTTARWMGAMSRAALVLLAAQDARDDLRVPIAVALLNLYGDSESEARLTELVELMLPIEQHELAPR